MYIVHVHAYDVHMYMHTCSVSLQKELEEKTRQISILESKLSQQNEKELGDSKKVSHMTNTMMYIVFTLAYIIHYICACSHVYYIICIDCDIPIWQHIDQHVHEANHM